MRRLRRHRRLGVLALTATAALISTAAAAAGTGGPTTIEQILGIQPMNQLDRAAEPMFDAFTRTPDTTPFTALPNQVPLDHGLKKPGAGPPGELRVPHGMERLARQWEQWSARQATGGTEPELDEVNPAQMNRVDWYEATGWRRPYPGDSRILAPDEVPGKDKPARELD
ncbi:hypothetical protein [Streptomyces sp. UNOC14_S4]|uniref:hypothetical protein n=1 Tax=Streptomyces sp. UNOC14_S4 TaxID=2872340 RepID=UPI001E5FF277|nr:hypothetical protein [Streptomyces sp. UNOC14_S4]MCC3769644.1 hypothetical protein [Streptomyces sp. UNOC14_S4]